MKEQKALFHVGVFLIVTVFALSTFADDIERTVKAFPGAEGFGAYAQGGRGGRVIFVTNLEDSGEGSLRAACEAEGPRIVIFRVSGIIALKSDLNIRNPFITIAGQTAPGDGICIKNYPLGVRETHDVIIRHLRLRVGDEMKKEVDALTATGSEHVIFDHCSASWGIDEIWSTNKNCKNLTTQWCLIAEALHNSYHKKGRHGYGSLVSSYDGGITMHHNLYAHNSSRNPRVGGRQDMPGVLLDFRNNVIYDWGFRSGYSGDENIRLNYVANYLKPGPSTLPNARGFAFFLGGTRNKIFVKDNRIEGFPEKDQDNWQIVTKSTEFKMIPGENPPVFKEGDESVCRVSQPFPAPEMPTESATEAYEKVLAQVGAILPKRDAVDARIIEQVKTGTGKLIDSQSEVGGWPVYQSAPPPEDSDEDGMPNEWESKYGLNPHDNLDANKDDDKDGYTNIEEYLNNTDPHHPDA